MAKKTTTKAGSNAKLKDELLKLIKDIDDKGLSLLIEEANKYKKSKTEVESSKTASVTITPDAKMTSFVVQIGTARKFFSRDDFRQIVKISHASKSVANAASELYSWLNKGHKDILTAAGIKKSVDAKMTAFINAVKSKYKPKAE